MSFTHSSNFSAFIHEAKNLIRLALPIFIGQFCMTCLGFIDTLMAADVGTVDLAAISLGTTFWSPVVLFGVGLTLALAPIVAQLKGARLAHLIPGIVHNSLLPSAIIAIISMLFLIFVPEYLFVFIDDSEFELKQKATDYLFYIAFGLPGALLFNILKNTTEGLSIALPSMIIGIVTLLFNIPINYIFIYGKFGMPAMGAVGCGVATTIVIWLSFFMLLGYSIWSKKLKDFKLLRSKHPFEAKTIKHICVVGFPIAIALIIETFSYSIVGYALTPFGSTVMAASQIANIICILVFMIPISIASAVTIRVGHSLGENSPLRVKRAALTGLGLAALVIIPTAFTVFCHRSDIIGIFTQDSNVISIVTPLFIFILIYQLQDALFGTTLGILRGFKDTRFLMNANFIILWIIGIPIGALLGLTEFFGKKYGVYGMWGTLVACYYVMTLTFSARTYYLFRNIDKYLAKNDKSIH